MKDIPGTITRRFSVLLPNYFNLGEVITSWDSTSMVIEKQTRNKEMIGLEYQVAVLITDPQELKIAMDHYNFLRKYNLA